MQQLPKRKQFLIYFQVLFKQFLLNTLYLDKIKKFYIDINYKI